MHKASSFVGKFLCPADIVGWRVKPSNAEDFIPGVVSLRCMTKSEYGLNYPEQFRQTFPIGQADQETSRKKREEEKLQSTEKLTVIGMDIPKRTGLNFPLANAPTMVKFMERATKKPAENRNSTSTRKDFNRI